MNYASWGKRVAAYIIDNLIMGVPIGIGYGVMGATIDPATMTPSGTGSTVALVGYLIGLALWVYNRCVLAGRTGQSWGKKALGITLLGEATGAPIGAGKAFLRDLAHVVDAIPCYIGFLFPLWDSKKQTLADKIVATTVVNA